MNLEFNIKNRMCYYFDNIMEVDEYITVDIILLDEKSYKDTLVYNILYKNYMDAKPLHIRFNKVDGIIKVCNEVRYLELLSSYNEVYSRIYSEIFDRINYLISEESGITDANNHNFARIRNDSYNSLSILLIKIKITTNNIFLVKILYKECNT